MSVNKKCLVYETLNNVSELSIQESKAPNTLRLSGTFGVCGVRNNNKRVYEKGNYGKMVSLLQEQISNGKGVPGELEHPNTMNINLENVSHKIESIKMNEDGTITGDIVLLNTPKGKIAQAIVEGGLPLFISSRGAGSIDESGNVTLSSLVTYDLVGTPGFSQASFGLSENQKFESLNESLCVIYEDEIDDLLNGGSDKKDDKKSDEHKTDNLLDLSSDKKDDKKDDKDDDDKSDKEDSKKDEGDKADDSDKEKNKEDKPKDGEDKENKDKVTMEDLKKMIEDLSAQVKDVQAQMHITQESVKENVVNYEAIESWVRNEFATDFKAVVADEISTKLFENYSDSLKEDITESVTESIQSWINEEYTPELANSIQSWVTEEFATEVQNWVCEEFAPEVQNWIIEEYSPTIQDWICEEYSQTVENWINEELTPEVYSTVNNNVNAFYEAKKDEEFDSITNILEAVEFTGKNQADIAKEINEAIVDKYANEFAVANMPAEYAPSWNMCTEAKKDEIVNRSRVYDFSKEGVLESFWATQDFTEETVNEAKVEQPMYSDYTMRAIASMKRSRNIF